jgi:hypothetical protein
MVSYGRGELPNTYRLSDVDKIGDNYDTSAKKRLYPTIGATTGIFVTLGQSRITNNSANGTPYTVSNTVASINLNPYDGFYYTANDPVLGCSASPGFLRNGWHGRLCDKLITNGKYAQVVVIPIGIAGSSVTEWSEGVYRDRIRAVCAMLTAMSLTPNAWLWQQGTTDAIAGMDQTTYQTALRSIIAYQRSLTGRSFDKWMIALDTINSAANTTSSALRSAQSAVAADSNNFLGPDCDTLTYPTNSDGTHFNAVGNDAVAALWTTKIAALL